MTIARGAWEIEMRTRFSLGCGSQWGNWKRNCTGLLAGGALLAACMGQSCAVAPPAAPVTQPDEQVLAYEPEPVPSSPAAPALGIAVLPSEENAPLSVLLTAVTLDGRVLPGGTYDWDFGDGTVGAGNPIMHQYSRAGLYAVTLCLTVGSGLTATTSCSDKEVEVKVSRPADVPTTEPDPSPAVPDPSPTVPDSPPTEPESPPVVANSPPTAASQAVETFANTPLEITLHGTDAAQRQLLFQVLGSPAHGTLGGMASTSPTSASVTYSPAAGYSGADSFTFVVNNGEQQSPLGTVAITVTSQVVNAPPVVNAGADQVIFWPADSVSLAGTATDDGLPTSPGAVSLSWTKVSGPGAVSFGSPAAAASTASFGAAGTYQLQLVAGDGLATAADTLSVQVLPAITIQATPPAGLAPLEVTLTAVDGNGDALTGLPAGSTFAWSFGDGSPAAAGQSVAHTYAAVGSYSVAVTLTLAGGQAVNSAPLTVPVALANNVVGPDGWTIIVPSADSRIVYVSSSEGDDGNPGLSPEMPVKTIARGRGLLRLGMPDWILFKRGDTFSSANFGNLDVGGRSAAEPAVFGAYGTGPRPIIDSGSNVGLGVGSGRRPHWVVIKGVEFRSDGEQNASAGLSLMAPSIQQLLVEDCIITGYVFGISIQGYAGTIHGVTIRRSVVAYNYSSYSHSSGLYADNVDGLTIEDCVFDHNGWSEAVAGAAATVFNHNLYIKENVTSFAFHNNISANASSHGIQCRSGGEVLGNLFINNPIGMSYGYVNGSPVTPGGVQGTVAGNVFIGDRDINGSLRGWAIEISNTKPGGGTTIHNNIIMGDTQNRFAAIHLTAGNVSNPGEAVGINDLTIRNNTISGWNSAILLISGMVPGGTGQYALNGLVVQNNDFQQVLSGLIIDHGPAFDSRYEGWQGNRYWASSAPATWFKVHGAATSWSTWQATMDPSGTSTQVAYAEPTRSIASYNGSIGGTPSLEAFLAGARGQAKGNWLTAYTAAPVITYVAAGFAN